MPPPPKVSRKVLIMGYRAVGKSTTAIQFVENHFVESYNPTIEDVFHKTIRYKGVDYVTEIVDTSGQDEFTPFPKHYSVGVHGYILLYSVASAKSFEVVKILNEKLLNSLGVEHVPRVFVGNKTDLVLERKVTTEEGQALAAKNTSAFVECSGKHNENVDLIFQTLFAEIEKHERATDTQAQPGNCALV